MKEIRLTNWLAVVACVGVMIFTAACQTGGGKGKGEGGMEGDPGYRPGESATGYAVPELKDVYFDYDQSTIRADQRDILESNADWLKSQKNIKSIQIEGHCDERGTEEYNLSLGERRAYAVRDFLISYGIDGAKIFPISYGEELPADTGHDEAAWAKNRRVHFLIATE